MFSLAAAAQPGRPEPLKSGAGFVSRDIREMQADDLANPGMLWVGCGEKLWHEPAGSQHQACFNCHGGASSTMRGVATRYPQIDRAGKRLINLGGRIQQCREQRQRTAPFTHESEELLALNAYVAHQSRGMPSNVAIDGASRQHFERGAALYQRRLGQMNLACTHCHDAGWGKKLGPETISQGHGNAYPIYRLEWQTVGSLQRRFRSCLSGVRAEMLPYGAPEYADLELYLAWRAGNLPLETPGVRR